MRRWKYLQQEEERECLKRHMRHMRQHTQCTSQPKLGRKRRSGAVAASSHCSVASQTMAELRTLKRRADIAEEEVRIKRERLGQAEQYYEEEHRTFTLFSKRLEEKWEQRFNKLAALASHAGVRPEDIEGIRAQPWEASTEPSAEHSAAEYSSGEQSSGEQQVSAEQVSEELSTAELSSIDAEVVGMDPREYDALRDAFDEARSTGQLHNLRLELQKPGCNANATCDQTTLLYNMSAILVRASTQVRTGDTSMFKRSIDWCRRWFECF